MAKSISFLTVGLNNELISWTMTPMGTASLKRWGFTFKKFGVSFLVCLRDCSKAELLPRIPSIVEHLSMFLILRHRGKCIFARFFFETPSKLRFGSQRDFFQKVRSVRLDEVVVSLLWFSFEWVFFEISAFFHDVLRKSFWPRIFHEESACRKIKEQGGRTPKRVSKNWRRNKEKNALSRWKQSGNRKRIFGEMDERGESREERKPRKKGKKKKIGFVWEGNL